MSNGGGPGGGGGDPFQNTPLHSRLGGMIDIDGVAWSIYLADCQTSPCGDVPALFRTNGRLEDLMRIVPAPPPTLPIPPAPPIVQPGGLVPVYIMPPPGCCTGDPEIIATTCTGSPTREMVLRFNPFLSDCGMPFCRPTKLVLDESAFPDKVWRAAVPMQTGTMNFVLACPDGATNWQLSATGCGAITDASGGTPIIHASVACDSPFKDDYLDLRFVNTPLTGLDRCCDPDPLCVIPAEVNIVGGCGYIKAARLVGFEDETPVYAWAECCPGGVVSVAPHCCARWPYPLFATVTSGSPACLVGTTFTLQPPSCGANWVGTPAGSSCIGTLDLTLLCDLQEAGKHFACDSLGTQWCEPDGYGHCDKQVFQAGILSVIFGCDGLTAHNGVNPLGVITHSVICNICECNGSDGQNLIDYNVTVYWQRTVAAGLGCNEFGTFAGDFGSFNLHITQ